MKSLYAHIDDGLRADLDTLTTTVQLPMRVTLEALLALLFGRPHPHAAAVQTAARKLRQARP